MIRAATSDDLDAVVAMAGDFIGTTRYGTWLTYRPAALRTFAERLVVKEDAVILLALTAEAPVGMIALWTFEHPMSGDLVASELVWWVDPAHRKVGVRLLRRAEAWARARGARELHMVAPTARVGEFYARVGYEPVEMLYRKPLR